MKRKPQFILITSSDHRNIGLIKIGPPTKKNIIKSIAEIEEKLKAALHQHFDNNNLEITEVLDAEDINAMFEYGKRVEVEVVAEVADEQDSWTEKMFIEKTWLFE
jgi:hypothetical protein